ncbi:MAG TPA: PAS domain-containing protein [Mucilaginibacter sp.]|nr:PAS domain-containing protein [Mucilaginibacter sp.]
MLPDHDLLHILTQSKDATAVYDSADLHIRFANQVMMNLWGKGDSVLGKTLGDAVPEIVGQPFIDMLKKVWHTGETCTGVDTPATLVIDGVPKTSFFDFEYRAISNNKGETIAILHTATDVSSRVMAWQKLSEKQQREQQLIEELSQSNDNIRATNDQLSAINSDLMTSNANITTLNDRLQESQSDFKRLVAQAPVAILVLRGKDLIIDLANAPMMEILDKDSSIIGRPILAGMPELKGEPAVELLFEIFETGKESNGSEVPVRMMRNGQLETRYFNFSYRPLRDGGDIVGVMDLAVEVTDQVMARKRLEAILSEKSVLEQSLRSNERRLQSILDTMAEGVVIANADGKLVYANAMAQTIMGVNEQEYLNRDYNDAKWRNERIDGTLLSKEDHPLYVTLRTGLPVFDQEVGIAIKGREKTYISVNAAPLLDDDNRVTGGIVTFTDVTNRRKILQEKDDFISVASHELKTPIASLKGALQLLDRKQSNISPDMLAKLIAQSNKSLNKLTDLVNSLLNSNRISQGRFPVHKSAFKIADLINECCQHIRNAGSHAIKFEGNLQLEVDADPQLIDQVIVNLVNNAVKYAPSSKEIIVSVQQEENFAKIAVTDFGPGISQDKLPYIFDRYYRIDTGTAQFSGLGLGLYICAEIIYKHGGKVGVESKRDEGSTFWFTLPLAS